jgi:hypothetical protein
MPAIPRHHNTQGFASTALVIEAVRAYVVKAPVNRVASAYYIGLIAKKIFC